LDKLGVIDFQGVDKEYVGRTTEAIKWLKELRKEGKNWTVDPPSREELYPNMCVDSGTWNGKKKEIADNIADITSIWYCGVKHRKTALRNGIQSWKDPECTAAAIGMGGVRGPVVDKIMDINRQDEDKIRPAEIQTNICGWKDIGDEMFVDFETLIDVFSPMDEIPYQKKTDSIFMIGVYYRDGIYWRYKSFIADDLTPNAEFTIMNNFIKFVRSRGNPKLWYWHAENMLWRRAENRQMDCACASADSKRADHIIDNWKIDGWADMAKLFRAEPIVIKDCFKYGLKEVAGAMRKHGMISARIESECSSGLAAAVKAWKAYESSDDPVNDPVIKDVEKYNEFDVKVLHEILTYLRQNHM
jgi:hypothetical protein